MSNQIDDDKNKRKQRMISLRVALFGIVMFGVAFAAVPLYDLFCRVTGYGGTTQTADAYAAIETDIPMNIRFDANISHDLPWKFRPKQREVTVNLGETITIEYEAQNLSDEPITGTATFNVSPESAGAYFNKIECFCFTEQKLAPGEKVDMPVNFFVDPEMLEDIDSSWIKTITLSYTFMRVDE